MLVVSDTFGLFNFLIPGTSFYSSIEASSWLVSLFLEFAFIAHKDGKVCGH